VQLLDSEQLECAFQLHGITLETQARQFYTNIWATIQSAEKAHDQASLTRHGRTLRVLCRSYFSLMREWQSEEAERHEHEVCGTSSHGNSLEARDAVPLFEKQFFRYTLCYLELNRALIQVRGQISSFAGDYNLDDQTLLLKVNHGTGALLARAHKERRDILEKRLRIERARTLLRASDPLMEELGADLPRLLGAEGDRQLTLFKGALRQSDFGRAESIARSWKNDHLQASGAVIASIVCRNAKDLKAQDGLLLHSGELSLISVFLKGDERRIDDFMNKHNIPYMIFLYRNLIHQGYLLGHIGSLEGLIVQHAKLVSLAARPQKDNDHARIQERAVLMPVRDLLQGKFTTLGTIFDGMETTLKVLAGLFMQTREYLANVPGESKN
jgi:hypothetical protein